MLQPGTIIGDRYEILETVGSGGMSVVYRAKCHKLNRYVAIKMLKPEYCSDMNFVSKFRVEAQSAACLSHPNIVSVYDVGEDGGMHYIVMELVEGITLKEYITRQGRLSVEQTLNFSMQIAAGIEVAHNNHIIHRDIKPQNIIVSRSGTLKVTDFGIARAATSNTISPTAMGSVHYISPEQARGGYSDERSDIYSLGITMYEMLTGRVPYEGENNVTVALMHIQEEMVSPRAYYPDIPVSMEKVIFKCTQKRAERRYLTANALIADLKKVAANPYAEVDVGGMATYNNSPTVMMTAAELDAIKSGAAAKPISSADIHSRLDNIMNEDNIEYEDYDDYEEEEYEEEDRKSYGRNDLADDEIGFGAGDDSDLDPKLEKAVMIGGIVVAVIVCIFLMVFISKITGWFRFGGGDTTATETASDSETSSSETYLMISVVGLTQEEAETKLRAAYITFYKIEYQESADVESGTVISQSVAEGQEVNEASNLVIVVSSGQEPVEIPDVIGKTKEEAESILREAGFEVKFTYEFSEEVEKDMVISCDPAVGESAAPGTKITVTVSNGKEFVEAVVPDLLDKTQKEAKKALEEVGLKLGKVTEEYSDEVEAGKVMRQSTSPGITVESGSKVDITISLGPKETTTSYTVSFEGTIENIDYNFEDGEVVTVKLVFKYDGGKVKYTLLEVDYGGGQFPINVNGTDSIKDLAKNKGSISLTVTNSQGEDISSHFSASNVTATFKEVTE